MIGINQFIYNGRRSYDDFDLIITQTPPFAFSERDIEFESISGRSGDIINDNGRYKNVVKEYKVEALGEKLPINLMIPKIASWLETTNGYGILNDTYDPKYFRYARVQGTINFSNKLMQLGAGTIKFNCKPFKYSFEGQKEIKISTPTILYNSEDIQSTPYIKIIGSGDISLFINNQIFSISNVEEYIEIDSEIMCTHKGNQRQNEKISFIKYPIFYPGKNDVCFSGNVNEIIIIPRWCAL